MPRRPSTTRSLPEASRVVVALVLSLGAMAGRALADADEFEPDRLDFQLEEPARFTLRNVFAPLLAPFVGGLGYWYDTRDFVIESSPPGARLELFYIRANFQRRYERAETPVTLVLPSRIASLDRDALRVRAFLPGFRQVETTLPIHTGEKGLLLSFEPLPNRLDAIAHRYLAGRASLELVTTELASVRVQREDEGFTLFLAETAMSDGVGAALEGVEDGLVAGIVARQVGEDLAVRVALRDGVAERVELRSRSAFDPVRERHTYSIDLVPADRGAASVRAAIGALERAAQGDVAGCALVFDAALRDALDEASLARSLAPHGDFTDRYVRGAMRRLGELSPDGVVEFVDGTTYRPAIDLELDVALSQASRARGLLALLRTFAVLVDGEHAHAALHGLVAPELARDDFEARLARAEADERTCAATR
ncbi:MAG: hypothetical protein R3E88_04425 [Myxococcota bacterium]